MAIRSSRRRRRPSAAPRAGRVVIALLLLGLAVYFVTVSAAGNWVAQNIVAPLFKAASPTPSTAASAPDDAMTVIDTQSGTASDAPAASGKTQQISVEAFTVYCLQMGAFSSEENANKEADNLRARGAGGYVLHEGGHYRVLASAYDTQEEIQEVREQLKAQSIDSGIYKIQANDVAMKITATDAQAQALKDALDLMTQTRQTLGAAYLALDRGEVSLDKSVGSIQELREKLEKAQSSLNDAAKGSSSPVLAALDTWFSYTLDALSSLGENNSQSTLDFSSQMKYTHIAIVYETRRFVEQIEQK